MLQDHFALVVVLTAFVTTLGAFVGIALIGADGQGTIEHLLLVLGGTLAGVTVPKLTSSGE